MAKSFKQKLRAVLLSTTLVGGAGIAMPSQAGFFDDIVDSAKDMVSESIKGGANGVIGQGTAVVTDNVQRGFEKRACEGKSGIYLESGSTDRTTRSTSGGTYNSSSRVNGDSECLMPGTKEYAEYQRDVIRAEAAAERERARAERARIENDRLRNHGDRPGVNINYDSRDGVGIGSSTSQNVNVNSGAATTGQNGGATMLDGARNEAFCDMYDGGTAFGCERHSLFSQKYSDIPDQFAKASVDYRNCLKDNRNDAQCTTQAFKNLPRR